MCVSPSTQLLVLGGKDHLSVYKEKGELIYNRMYDVIWGYIM